MAVQVRRAVCDDAAPMAVIHVQAWKVAYRGLMPDEVLERLSVEQRQEMWRQALAAESPVVYVAAKRGVVVGFCAVAAPSRDDHAEDRVAELVAIYVNPDLWRAGVGRALMDVALEDLRDGGWRWVTLWVLAENRPARDFYTRFGFVPDGAEMLHECSGETEVRLRGSLTS